MQYDLCLVAALPNAVRALFLTVGCIPDSLSFNIFSVSLLNALACSNLIGKVSLAQQAVAPTRLVVEFSETLDMPWESERQIIQDFQRAGVLVAKDDHSKADGLETPRLMLPWNWIKLDMANFPFDEAVCLIRTLKRGQSRPVKIIVEQCDQWADTLRLFDAGADAFQAHHHGRPFLLPAVTGHPNHAYARLCQSADYFVPRER